MIPLRLAFRALRDVSPRLLFKAAWLWAVKGMWAVQAYRQRVRRGELFPPFLFLALTNACNLRCRGCWIQTGGPVASLPRDDVERLIEVGKQHAAYFYTLLGGEPMMYPALWRLIEDHPECYFQIITNGLFLNEENVRRIRTAGNVTPLVSLDGWPEANDARRGQGVYAAAMEGIERLHQAKILYGLATTITGQNLDDVLCEEYVGQFIDRGAMYLWYYVFRPVGADPAPELCVDRAQMLHIRRRLLEMRRRYPILLIDTYWNAEGEAVCPAALGLGFHIGPRGSIEPCPPLSFACQTITDNGGDLFKTIDQSPLLREFQQFVGERTKGCVILEHPQELAAFFRRMEATDTSGRDALAELAASTPRSSHHLPGEELPEDSRFYRFLKRQLFFGMGGYG